TATAQVFADVRSFWSPEAIKRVTGKEIAGPGAGGFLYLANSGAAALDGTGTMEIDGLPAMKPFWQITSAEANHCLEAVQWGPAKLATFRGGGFSSAYESRGGMPFTMLRLNLVKGLGPALQLAQGHSIDLPEEVRRPIVGRTDPTWPRTFFVPNLTGHGAFRNAHTVMKKWGSNHCVLCCGHVGADLITLASMLRIPVSMHNIEEENIFRPSAWDAFGTGNPETADFRACSILGPLY
ncbi:MAG: L-fucose isomerase, partial [Proteobacteria bacterium]|nr:L-fucose isomerase [Pseudomonadota bacterium]